MQQARYSILIGSFVVAASFWFSVTMSGSFRSRVQVPLVVTHLPDDLAVAKPLPKTIEVLLEGTGWQLLLLSAGPQVLFEVRGKHLRSGVILTNRDLQTSMKVPPGVSAIQAYPDTLIVDVDRFITKRVPLRFDRGTLEFKPGFGLMREIRIIPDSITLKGADRILRHIDSWAVESKEFPLIAVPLDENLAVIDSLPGIVFFDIDKVKLFVPTEEMADMVIEDIPIVVKNVPPGREILLTNTTLNISVRGGVNFLSTLSPRNIRAEVEYAVILADTSGVFIPSIFYPTGLELLNIEPPEIRYTIRE